ncbi:hypothetical protein DICVIV_07954 [Dictyocaulus viviparus]|uniref:Uncharacterized protein n=1 Tax=Dictyocaulus viviparus TaxID=29172 RepID=A0A0D8XUD8_DICVI|nr:hypothetical protein DICVIV_07954 [Dictyocaulus viviparus]
MPNVIGCTRSTLRCIGRWCYFVTVMPVVLIEWLALALQLLSLTLFTCNRAVNRFLLEKQRNSVHAGVLEKPLNNDSKDSKSEEYENEYVTKLKQQINPKDSIRIARFGSHSRSRKRLDSESSYTEIIVVPLGKAQHAVVNHTNLTTPKDRKRDPSSKSSKASHKMVKFIDTKKKNVSRKQKSIRIQEEFSENQDIYS